MGKKKFEEALKKIADTSNNFIPQRCGGLVVKKCRHCGGNVTLQGEGVLVEVCSSCGKAYYEVVYGAGV